MDRPPAPFGPLLRQWRVQRRYSQLALALQAQVSTRHLSWLETGKAQPSRAMVLRLAEQLDLPPRERNTLLAAAGYAPLYPTRPLSDPTLAPARAALQRLLDAHEPWPALAVDGQWCLVASNRMVPLLLAGVAPALLQPPVNVLRLSLHPQGLAPMVVHLEAWRAHVLGRLARQVAAGGDERLRDLLVELQALPPPPRRLIADEAAAPADEVVVPLSLVTSLGRLNFITTVTVFGAPHELTLAELAVETLLPADDATAEVLRRVHAGPLAAA